MQKIKSNKVLCKRCGTIIESKSVHVFQTCQCGDVSVDGGHYYLKRSFQPNAKWDELSEYEEGSNGQENNKS